MRKLFILLLVVLLLVSFVAVLPVSARHTHEGNWTGAQGGKWSNAGPQPGWSHVNPGQGGTGPGHP
jgi:hypothetical protein